MTAAIAGLLAVGFITLSIATTVWQHDQLQEEQRAELTNEAHDQAQLLNDYFARAEGLTLLLAQNSAFSDFYRLPGSRKEKIKANGRVVRKANRALADMETLFPGSIGEACFIDANGAEIARAVHGEIAPIGELSTEETSTPIFKPTFALRPGQVYQARPYISPDTHDWVIANATPVQLPRGAGAAIVHFEVTVASFRDQAAASGSNLHIAVVDGRSGGIVFDTADPGPPDAHSHGYSSLVGSDLPSGDLEVEGRPAAVAAVQGIETNANQWIVVVTPATTLPSWVNGLGAPQIALIVMALVLLGFAVISFRSSQGVLRVAALTDPLTGLGNRRKLMDDLAGRIDRSSEARPLLLSLFDLDGFKSYNDSFGHPAGDALLVRLAAGLGDRLGERGEAYRIGGDEFCVLSADQAIGEISALASDGLSEEGDGFKITSSYGSVVMPDECQTAEEALQLADQRMYTNKGMARASVGRQTTDVLVRVLAERYPDLGEHNTAVAQLCEEVADELKVPAAEHSMLLQAAALHDIGKIAVPDSILHKPGPLDESEWTFIRQHTIIGERILAAAPALTGAAKLVRWSHERTDGTGYPDGLAADQIPLGSKIIAVCDAFDAIVNQRSYSAARPVAEALDELRRCAGTQFDPEVVAAFVAAVERRDAQLELAAT
jgi:diguanylate cyclase (GGDEF)-like protein